MGTSRWSSDAYAHLKDVYSSKTREEVFSRSGMHPDMSPLNLKFREARDSEVNPATVPIIIALDVTGSMGHIPEFLIKEKLGVLIETLIANDVKDPAILFSAIGDHRVDNAPLQIGQFESGTTELNHWLSNTWLEGAGGDAPESYGLAHLFAARHTSIDAFEKRGLKGFLITIGDQEAHETYEGMYLQKIFGNAYQKGLDFSLKECIEAARRLYNVIHINVSQISTPEVTAFWRKYLGQQVVELTDYTIVAETIATLVSVYHGNNLNEATKTFSEKTRDEVSRALVKVKTDPELPGKKEGIIHL